jgi:acyl-CoA thioesterase-1
LGRLISFPVARAVVALAVLLTTSACGDSPAAPTPVPPPPLTLTCPAAVSQLSPTGQAIGIRYGSATATGGTPPVQITCTPASDALFQVGRTTVTCNGADTKGVTASCSFAVTVTAPPTISLTQYLAFGDSITAGEITIVGEGLIHTLQVIDALSYPTDLRASLLGRYTAQSISVINQGLKNEITAQGLSRLPAVLGTSQVLLLLEGANDISGASDAQVLTALSNIRAMVRLAKGRGLRVFLGTLPPENPTGCFNPCRAGGAAQLPSYNLGLQAIAASENVPLVDVFTAFHGDVTTLIGPDGLHPTAQGYRVMADAFFNAIKATLEVPSTSLVPSSLKAPFFVAPWRR